MEDDSFMPDFMEYLKEDPDLEGLFSQPLNSYLPNNNVVYQGEIIQTSQSEFSLSSLEGFDQPNFSASDTSLADQNSPQVYSPGYTPYGARHSPGSGSVDSGLPNSIASTSSDSPQLSPDSISACYGNPGEYLGKEDGLLDNLGIMAVNDNESAAQRELALKYLQEQFQQFLIQQQNKDMLQQQLQLNQQRLLLFAQQQQQQQQQQKLQEERVNTAQNYASISETLQQPSNKNDSQLRKMLMQTKNNIMNTLQDKKEKISSFKFPKPGHSKPNKRKLLPNQTEEKNGKIPAFISSNEIPILSGIQEISAVEKIEGLLAQQVKQPVVSQSTSQPITMTSVLTSTKPSDSLFCPQSISPKSPGSGIKLPLSRLKHATPIDAASQSKKSSSKRPRVEHVVIEKRYRMKITDSLNELKVMLPCSDDKKATKNTILQAAIEEIRRLKKENETLTRRNGKMRKLFEQLRNIGIIPSSQPVSSSSSESNISEESSGEQADDDPNVEPEVNQDHYASPFQRQSARDGAKLISCFTVFLFLFVNPLNMLAGKTSLNSDDTFSSRHLMGIREQDTSPQFSLASNLINIVMSLFILMFVLLRGNPKCKKNSKLTQCFRSQLTKAQKKINKHEYEDGKGFLRIALFIIGNSCPKTLYGQLASFLWKCICHMMYQLGILTTLETVGRTILPAALSGLSEKSDQEFAARLSAEAYRKLHEIAIKDPSSTYLEAACYIVNAVHSAEVSGDHELLSTAYATAVIHMKEKAWSYFLQYYFTVCAHHASLASKDTHPYAVDWIFENRGYEYFTSGLWDIKKQPALYINDEDSDLDEADLLQMVFAQFQEHMLMKALKRITVPETYYPNEGRIELRQRSLSFLENLGTGPVSEQVDTVSLYHQSLYGWWGAMMKHLISVMKNDSVDKDELRLAEDLFEDIHEHNRHELMIMTKAVVSQYIIVRNLKSEVEELKVLPTKMYAASKEIRFKLLEASHMIDEIKSHIISEENTNNEMQELILIMCCDAMIEASHVLWEINSKMAMTEQELNHLLHENDVLQSFASKFPELGVKVQQNDFKIISMSGTNECELNHLMRRTKHMKTVGSKKNDLNCMYQNAQQYPLKQDGYLR